MLLICFDRVVSSSVFQFPPLPLLLAQASLFLSSFLKRNMPRLSAYLPGRYSGGDFPSSVLFVADLAIYFGPFR